LDEHKQNLILIELKESRMNSNRHSHLILASVLAVAGFATSGSALAAGAKNLYIAPAASAGTYNLVDQAQIVKYKMDWSLAMQKQDEAQYSKAVSEAQTAYEDLYKNGLIPLRAIHNDTFLGKMKIASPIELATAIDNFIQRRDLFEQKIAVLETASDVWKGLQSSVTAKTANKDAVEQFYQRGSINLQSFVQTYRDAIAKMTKEASDYRYIVQNGMTGAETAPGNGLVKVGSEDTPEFIKQKLEVFAHNARITEDDKAKLSRISYALVKHMGEFVNATNMKMYWMNAAQKGTRDAWIKDLETKARVLKYARGRYCMPIGVPALSLPELKAMNLGYLTRDFKSQIRLVPTAEFDTDSMRKTMMRFDESFLSLQSQGGELDGMGGFVGFLNRVNSTLAWHNEVAAYLSVMKIVRDMYMDELDVASDPISGCEKVRARYNQTFGSFLEENFQRTATMYLAGTSSTDSVMQDFNVAGTQVIIPKGKYLIEYRALLKKHPETSPMAVSDAEKEDGLK
jgi:hypothetical protein